MNFSLASFLAASPSPLPTVERQDVVESERVEPFFGDVDGSSSTTNSVNWTTASSPASWTSSANLMVTWENSTSKWTDLDYYYYINGTDSAAVVMSSNYSDNGTNVTATVLPPTNTVAMVITSVILGLLILTTVIGNVFVIAAILLERNLQNVANFLILSLAVADLMVACLVMPLGAVYEVSKEWILGPELCEMWTSSDVLCCTASILHLVAIAVDRFWAVTNVDYIHQRNSRRIGIMIVIVWVVAVMVSLAPSLGWKDPKFHERISEKKCLVSQDMAYQLFATMATFYVPLIVILFLYWRIFQTARKRIRRKIENSARTGISKGRCSETTAFTSTANATSCALVPINVSPEKSSSANGSTSQTSHISDMSRLEMLPKKDRKLKESPESKREKKAAKTLAIITGAFVVCWLPFFVVALMLPVCGDDCYNAYMMSFFLWLGYFNSTLNPIIYTIFSPEFRCAFRRILFGRRAGYRPKR